MIDARSTILDRIRTALADGHEPKPQQGTPFRRSLELTQPELVALFVERIADYDVTVRLAKLGSLARVLTETCAAHGAKRLGVPADLPRAWEPAGVELVRDAGLSNEELDGLDGALTGSRLAIAETGTIVLDGGPVQGRRALTLVPDLHVCIVSADDLVGTVPEAFDRISVDRPVTFVSGPSATSDIELSRVHGVHGPRRLEVVLVTP